MADIEFWHCNSSVTDLSVNDVFESEVQSEMAEILRSDSARFSPQPRTDLVQQSTGLADSTDFADLGSLPNYFQEQGVQTTAQDINSTSVLTMTSNTVDLSQISAMDSVDNQVNSLDLLVDPQTGLPVSTTTQLQLDPNSAQASLQMIVNSLPELQAQIASSSAENLGLANIGNIISQAPILSLNTQPQQLQQESPLILSTATSDNQNLTFQNGTLQQSDLQQINLSNFHELATQTFITQLQQQQQLHLANGNVQTGSLSSLNSALKVKKSDAEPASPKTKTEKIYPKPAYSYSCLITMALKNSQTGCLPVSEIYQFMCEYFPYFKTAPDGWKNSVRHNLSLNKCFAKIEKPTPTNGNGSTRKGCLWALNPEKQAKMEEEVCKWTKKDPLGIKRSMAKPEEFDKIEALSRCSSSPKPSPKPSSPPQAPPPLQSIITTATTTTLTSSDIKAEDSSSGLAEQYYFNTSLNMLDPTLTQLDGDLGLQDNLLDTFNDLSSLDVPMTTSPLTTFSLSGSILDTSPVKDSGHTVTTSLLPLDSPQAVGSSALQFCSPTRTPQVTAFM